MPSFRRQLFTAGLGLLFVATAWAGPPNTTGAGLRREGYRATARPTGPILVPSAPDPGKFKVVFFTGVRYSDGYGDLSLNKYLIDEQIGELRRRYGNAIEINVAYLDEVADSDTTLKGREAVEKIFKGSTYEPSVEHFKQHPSGEPFVDKTTGVRFWTESDLKKFSGSQPGHFDLGIMASETSKTLAEAPKYHLPPWISENMNVVAFREYSQQTPAPNGMHADVVPVVNRAAKRTFVEIKVDTGAQSGGLISNRNPEFSNKDEITQLIRDDLGQKQGRFIPKLDLKPGQIEQILQSDPYIVPSYLSKADGPYVAERRAIRSILLAFLHSEKQGGAANPRGYVVFSNGFPKTLLDTRIEGEFGEYLVMAANTNDVNSKLTPAEAEALRGRFHSFLENRVLVLGAGEHTLNTSQMRGLFNPANKAIFAQTAGYGSLADSLSVGDFPIIMERKYHEGFQQSLETVVSDYIGRRHGPEMGTKAKNYIHEMKGLGKSSGTLGSLVADSAVLEPAFHEAALHLRDEANLNTTIADAVDTFARAKQSHPGNFVDAITDEKATGSSGFAQGVRSTLNPNQCERLFRVVQFVK